MKFNLIPFILLMLCFGCSDPESTAEKFFNKIAVDQDFDGAYEMLSDRAKKEISKEAFSKDAKELLAEKKYADLYKYEAKRRDFKIVKTQKNGSLMETVYFTFRFPTRYRNFFRSHSGYIEAAKTDDLEKVYDDKFLLNHHSNFFDEDGERLKIIKEDGNWKIDTNRPEDLISDLAKFSLWYEDLRKERKAIADEEKFQNSNYAVLLFRELGYVYGGQKSRQIALCVSEKIGDLTYREVIKKYPPKGPKDIIKQCSLAVVGYSL